MLSTFNNSSAGDGEQGGAMGFRDVALLRLARGNFFFSLNDSGRLVFSAVSYLYAELDRR